MKTLSQALILISAVMSSISQPDDDAFRCVDSTTFVLYSTRAYQEFTCPHRTFCSPECSFPCCNVTSTCELYGFFCKAPDRATLCVDGESSGQDIVCPRPLICDDNCEHPCGTIDCKNTTTCEKPGFLPDPNDEAGFYLCGSHREATRYSCFPGFLFDSEQVCARPGNETSTISDLFVCESEGKFPDPFSCSLYHLCVNTSSGLLQISISCPKDSVFDPETGLCTRNTSVCYFTPPFTSTTTTTTPTTTTPTTTTPTTTTQTPTITPDTTPETLPSTLPPLFTCTEPGNFPDFENCSRYYECRRRISSDKLVKISRRCFFWRKFDSVTRRCRPASAATCATLL